MWSLRDINLKRKWQFQSCSSSNDQQREEKHINTTQPHAGLHTDGSVRPVWLSWGLRAAFRNEQCLSEVPTMMCTIYPSLIDHTAKHCSMVTGCALGQVSWELGSWFRRDRAVLAANFPREMQVCISVDHRLEMAIMRRDGCHLKRIFKLFMYICLNTDHIPI